MNLVRSFVIEEEETVEVNDKTDSETGNEEPTSDSVTETGENIVEEVVVVESEEPTELTAESTVHRRHIVADTINA